MNLFNKNKIDVEGFGKKSILLYELDGTNEIFTASFKHLGNLYQGVVDKNGRILIPFDTIQITDIFSTKDYENYCITKYNENSKKYHSYHLQFRQGAFYLVADIVGNNYTNCRLIASEKDEFWFIEATTNDITEISLYDVYNYKIITPGFTEISFEQEESRVLAFVEKALYTKEGEENIYLSSLLGYIDYDGNFITPLLEAENELEYDTRKYNYDKTFKSFNTAIQLITEALEIEYQEKSQRVNEELANLFNNPYTEEEMQLSKTKTRIIEFNNRRK